MSRPWIRFLSSLELKGLTFDDVQLASDRLAVIHAAGITDPLTVAIVETEWQRRAGGGGGSNSSANVSGIASPSTTVLPTPRGLGAPGISGANNGILSGLSSGSSIGVGGLGGIGLTGHLFQLKDPSELKQLPEELQDVILTREVLNAVLGLGGDFIRRSTHPVGSSGSVAGFDLSPAVPQPMRGICETILPVADAFVALRQVEDAEYLGKSLVAMALGEVVSEICTAYALEISKLQQWSRDDPYGRVMPLMRVVSDITRIGHHLVRLRQVLPVELVNFAGAAADPMLCSSEAFLSAGQRAFLSGSRLLNHLSEQLERCGGSKEESDVLHLLLRRAMVPYLKMLQRWMHEGMLEDPFGEFFITENSSPSGRGYSSASSSAPLFSSSYYSGGVSQQQRSSKEISQIFPEVSAAHEHYGGYRHNYSSGGAYGASHGGGGILSHQEATAFERRFSMNKLLMPSFLEKPSRIAKMIFFTGKYCCLLRECHVELPDFSSTTTQVYGAGSRADGSGSPSSNVVFSQIGLESQPTFVWRDVEDMHQKIQRSFELASQAVIRLLFSPKVDLLGHLTSLKIFYLHSQGDWITDFLDSADDLLSKSRDKVKGYSLRVLLQASIARCCSAHDPYHDIIGCSFSDSTLEQHLQRWRKTAESGSNPPTTISTAASPTTSATGTSYEDPSAGDGRLSAGTKVEIHRCIELLQLEADLKWPLTLILDPTVMARFNSIFRLLTWIKVCERSLCSLWSTNEVLASFPAAYGIKHHFIQFLRQFQFFAAHFVLEPLWARLMSRLGPSDSLFAISQAINDFFTEVESGLTLSSPTRFKSLRSVLSLVSRFCEIGRHSSAATLPLIEATLHSVQDQYLTALSELASAVGPDYSQLIPLLTCIDFNGFYDRHNVYHVQSGA